MRQLILEEPMARAAVWSRRLIVFALSVALIGIIMARLATTDMAAPFAVLGAAFAVAGAAGLLAAAALVKIWNTGQLGAGHAILSGLLAAAVVAYPAWLGFQAFRVPQINDVTTDVTEPPSFSRSSRALVARFGHVPGDPPPGTRETQVRAYPAVEPILLDFEADEVFGLVQKAIAARGWKVIEQVGPGGRSGIGHIDAIDRSLILGLPDDIAVRIRPLAGRTRIDVRSVSRFGRTDFGANARRIQKFSDELEVQLEGK